MAISSHAPSPDILINDARTLAAFASSLGIEIPDDIRRDVVQLQSSFQQKFSAEDEGRINEIIFRLAFNIKPHTLQDARITYSQTFVARIKRLWRSFQRGKSGLIGNLLNIFGICLLALVIALTTNFTTLSSALNDFKRINVSEYFDVLQSSYEISRAAPAKDTDAQAQREYIKKLRLTDSQMISGSVALLPAIDLQSSSPNWCMLLLRIYMGGTACNGGGTGSASPTIGSNTAPVLPTQDITTNASSTDDRFSRVIDYANRLGLSMTSPDQIKFSYTILNQAGSLVLVLGSSILPLMYGFLGATVYLMRQFAGETGLKSGSSSFAGRIALRIGLGGVAGLAIGWFWTPAASKNVSDLTAFSTTPFALAFLAGFSIELLFSILDRILAAINPPSTPVVLAVPPRPN